MLWKPNWSLPESAVDIKEAIVVSAEANGPPLVRNGGSLNLDILIGGPIGFIVYSPYQQKQMARLWTVIEEVLGWVLYIPDAFPVNFFGPKFVIYGLLLNFWDHRLLIP